MNSLGCIDLFCLVFSIFLILLDSLSFVGALLYLIHLTVRLSLFVDLPVDNILLSFVVWGFHGRHSLLNEIPHRDDNVVTETWLLLGHESSCPIAKEGCRHWISFLNITLNEKFVKQQVRPLFESVEIARWRRQITCMDQKVQILLLALEEFLICRTVDDQMPILFILFNIVVLNFEVDDLDVTHVLSHVRC